MPPQKVATETRVPQGGQDARQTNPRCSGRW